jgi:hypothetical protein
VTERLVRTTFIAAETAEENSANAAIVAITTPKSKTIIIGFVTSVEKKLGRQTVVIGNHVVA